MSKVITGALRDINFILERFGGLAALKEELERVNGIDKLEKETQARTETAKREEQQALADRDRVKAAAAKITADAEAKAMKLAEDSAAECAALIAEATKVRDKANADAEASAAGIERANREFQSVARLASDNLKRTNAEITVKQKQRDDLQAQIEDAEKRLAKVNATLARTFESVRQAAGA